MLVDLGVEVVLDAGVEVVEVSGLEGEVDPGRLHLLHPGVRGLGQLPELTQVEHPHSGI